MNQKGFAPILIILGIVLVLGAIGGAYYLGTSKPATVVPVSPSAVTSQPSISPTQSPVKTVVSPTPTSAMTIVDETTTWKTYQQTIAHFLIKYPQTWEMKENLNNNEPYQVKLNGTEGNIIITWGDGFGGGCDLKNHLNFILGGENEDICHFIYEDGSESWAGMGKVFSEISVNIQATANSPYKNNRDMILKILSTFKFTQ